jgi:hypothetical protein
MRTTALLPALAVLALTAAPVDAREPGPYEVKQLDAKAPLPKGVKAKGKIVEQVWSWQDGDMQTDGLAVFSSTETSKGGRVVTRKIYVQYFRGKAGKLKEVRLVQDSSSCDDGDLVAQFVEGSVSITDEDTDSISELSFAYDLNCTTDMSPHTRKLILLEGKDKHALRGSSQMNIGGDQPELVGGDYKADPFKKAAPLKAHAEAQWKALLGK